MTNVLVISDAGGVSEFYRTLTPYRLLADAGLITLTVDGGLNPAIIDHLSQFDAVVFSRADSAEHSLLLLHAKTRGLRVVFDMDDNLLAVPPSIGVYGAWRVPGTKQITPRLYYLKRNIQAADVLTVSTRELGRQLAHLRTDYTVLPNMVLAADWAGIEPVDKPAGEVWVGWWGIYNHWDDWRDVAPYIEPVLLELPHTRLVLLGMPELAQLFPRLAQTGQLATGPFVEPGALGDYRRVIAALDVALAPTAACDFNRSKSDLKLLQYGIAGVPAIASGVTYGDWREYATVIDAPQRWGIALRGVLAGIGPARAKASRLQTYIQRTRIYENTFKSWLHPLASDQTGATPVHLTAREWQYQTPVDMTEEAA
jgi:hypothetical protein